MSKYLKEVKFTADSNIISKYGMVAVDLHFQKDSPLGGADNVSMNVFIKANPTSTVSEIEKTGLEQAKIFLAEVLRDLET